MPQRTNYLRAGDAGTQDAAKDGTQRLLEYSTSSGLTLRVDAAQGVIGGVKILGLTSANGREYSREAITAARGLYENRPVNVDHLDGSRRSYRDRIGKICRVEVREDGLYGDLLVNPKHPLAEQLLWDAQHAPENVGLSHDAQGRTVVRAGRVIVEAIHTVRSVDLVAEPATTKGLFEDAAAADPAGAGTDANDGDEPVDDPVDEPVDDPDGLPDEAFALVLPGGIKYRDRTYPLSKRYFPIHTPPAVRRSLARIGANQKLSAAHRAEALQRAKDAARRFGINPALFVKEAKMAQKDLGQLTLAELKEARPDLVAELQAAGETEKQLAALKEEHDRAKAELARFQRREALRKELAEARMDWEKIPKSFQELLVEAADDRRKQLLEDLRALEASRLAAGPQSARPGTETMPAAFEERVKTWSI